MRTRVGLLLCALSCACASPERAGPVETEAELQKSTKTVVHLDGLTLNSPYDSAATEEYARVLVEQSDLVRALFGDAGVPPIRFYLVPAPEKADGSDLPVWEDPGSNGWGGGAFHEGFAFSYVRASAAPTQAAMQATMSAHTLRHELTHVVARRAGLDRRGWFNEGLAREVEHMRAGPAGLTPHAFPAAIVVARQSAHAGTVQELLDWKLGDGTPLEERARRYDQSEALFRFLSQRQVGGSWTERAHAVMTLEPHEVVALEPAWLEWLAGRDVLTAVRAGMRSSDASERAECASWLPVLAEQGATELSTRGADELALDLLADPVTCVSASTFLIFFRARALTEADLVELCRSPDPVRCLTGFASRKRRGEPVDMEQLHAAWTRVPEGDRSKLETQRSVLGIADDGIAR